MSQTTDPTFYRSPGDAIAAPPESLAYVAAFDPSSRAKDAIAVIDCDAASATFGRVVGWSELPTAGNELHHFGWNACSSALCHSGHAGHGGGSLERRYLIVPGLRSSRTYVLDTKPDPRSPQVTGEITAEELAAKAGQSLNTWLVNAIRTATREQPVRVDIDLSSIPFGGFDPFAGRTGSPRSRRMTGWL